VLAKGHAFALEIEFWEQVPLPLSFIWILFSCPRFGVSFLLPFPLPRVAGGRCCISVGGISKKITGVPGISCERPWLPPSCSGVHPEPDGEFRQRLVGKRKGLSCLFTLDTASNRSPLARFVRANLIHSGPHFRREMQRRRTQWPSQSLSSGI
jgi:hypothetical protein